MKTVALFPLPKIVLQPGMRRPLNIFEPRYRQMVEDCVELEIPVALAFGQRAPFGDVMEIPHESLPFVKRTCGFGHIKIIEERDDGSLLVVLKSVGKLRLSHVIEGEDPYILCEGEVILEDLILEDQNEFMFKRLCSLLDQKLNSFVGSTDQKNILYNQLQTPAEKISFYIDFIIEDSGFKQDLLEMNDLNSRIEALSYYNVSVNANLTHP